MSKLMKFKILCYASTGQILEKLRRDYKVYNQAWRQVQIKVYDQVSDQVRDQVKNQVKKDNE